MHRPPVRRRVLQGLALLPMLAWLPGPVNAQGVELASVGLRRADGALLLDFSVRLVLTRTVEDALQRGVPVYFAAQAALYRTRWYWRDERVARVSRSWRIAYQPLTSTWRVGFGALNQSVPTLAEALVVVSSGASWKVAELAQLDPDARHYLEFEYRLDTSQLPSPMQIGLGGQAEWVMGAERRLRVD